jgi:hypothetical protein
MEKLKKDLQAVSKEIKALTKKLDRLVKSVGGGSKKAPAKKKGASRKKPAVKKKTSAKKTASKATAFDTVITLISRSQTGVNTSQIKAKTKFDDKKIANIIFKGKNRGLIKSISKGIYKKA